MFGTHGQGCGDVHDLASLLCRWLREQYPMVPPPYVPLCAELAGVEAPDEAAVEMCVEALPQPGQGLLRALVQLLQQLHPTRTRMTPESIGRVFAPVVIRRSDPAVMLAHVESDARFVTTLVRLLPCDHTEPSSDDGSSADHEPRDVSDQVGLTRL